MAGLMGSIPPPHYDMQTDGEVIDAKMDLICKVCEYLVGRLRLYDSDMRVVKRSDKPNLINVEDEIYSHRFITLGGWQMLFHAEPSTRSRRVCSDLYSVYGSINAFWRGCFDDNFVRLHTVCIPFPTQPQNLLRKHFLFFQYLFAYLEYVRTVVQRVAFPQFSELEELHHFLNFLVSTQFLLCDLLDTNTTPIGRPRIKLREHAEKLYNLVDQCVKQDLSFHRAWRNIRGDLTMDFMQPNDACINGQFYVLGVNQRMAINQVSMFGHGL